MIGEKWFPVGGRGRSLLERLPLVRMVACLVSNVGGRISEDQCSVSIVLDLLIKLVSTVIASLASVVRKQVIGGKLPS